jgi:RHS repeat-associated protein
VRREFDARGRLTTDYAPYFASGADNGYGSVSYDQLDRPVSESLYRTGGSWDRTTSTSWSGLTRSQTDPLSHTTTQVATAWGLLLRVVDAANGQTNYTYDAFDALKQVTDPDGNVVMQNAYNVRGMLTQTVDMDRGTTNFTPNALGELATRTSAKGQTATYSYDALGRLVQRQEPEGTSTWTWGNSAAADNIGRLQSVTGPGYGETYAYDTRGRLVTRTVTADTAYQFDYTYNATTGQPQTLTYPVSTAGTRFKVKYGYSSGRMSSVQDYTNNVNGAVLWNLNLLDAQSHAISETYANGLWLQNTYDALTGLPLTRQSGMGGSPTNVQNLSYAWDTADNLSSRADLRQSLTESFTYDALGRMTWATGPGAQSLSIGYEAIGNIASKTGLGTYTYDTTRGHAVAAAGGTSYAYDANGNMSSRGGAAVAWASYDLPVSINDPSGFDSQFAYTPDRSRWRQIATYANGTETTIYVGGLLEKLTTSSSGRTHWKHLISTPSGQIQVIRRSDGTSEVLYSATDHLGSVDVVTNSAASVVARLSYTAHGARRNSTTWIGAPTSSEWLDIASTTRRGFTGHEHLDNISLVHMNGRIFDPQLGRFISADPYIDGADTTQGWNRYSYVHNTLLNAIDPSGFQSWDLPELDDGPSFGFGFFGGGGGYIYGSRIPEREPGKVREQVAERRARGNTSGEPAFSTGGGTSVGQEMINATVPGAYYGGQAELAWREERYVDGGLFFTASLLEAGIGLVTLGRSTTALSAARAITAETSVLARASEAALRAAGRADEFALGTKHAAGAGGRWAKFAEGVDPNAALRDALSAPGARILPNDANSFRVVTDLGRTVGSRGETEVRAVVDFEGHVVTWFPVRP